jgi:hypothetical protein
MTACCRCAASNARIPSDLPFWSPRRDSNPRPSDYESVGHRPPGPAEAHRRCSRQGHRPTDAGPYDRMLATGLPDWLPPARWSVARLACLPSEGRSSPVAEITSQRIGWIAAQWTLPRERPAKRGRTDPGALDACSDVSVCLGTRAGVPCRTDRSTHRAGGSSPISHHQPSHPPNHQSRDRPRHHRSPADHRDGGRRTATRCGAARGSGSLPAASARCCWWWDCSPTPTRPRRRRLQPPQRLRARHRPRQRRPPQLHLRRPLRRPRSQNWSA